VLRPNLLRPGAVAMIHESSRHAWTELDAKLRAYVSRRVRSPTDIDDLVQSVFLRMQRGLSDLRDEERFGPYVYRVARSVVADYYEQSARHPLSRGESNLEAVAEASEEEAPLLASYVATFVAMLPSPFREALTLTELEGLTQKAAADMVGVSLSGMKSRVQRGRALLRELIDASCHVACDVRGRVVSCEPKPTSKLPNCTCAQASADDGAC
jgi:RNA polymerase sigma-70 factor (ECF subfamily)